ncbi:MAG: hypothetical protein DRJ42_03890 [Deltaproteobacteria bacterium]|nr:MAG: hypothetical protein DRJ42_03890 [Deltaproteobacteria bacterium]
MLQDFGPYSVVRKLAVGGMAEIYLAREHGLEGLVRSVVIKRVLPTYSDNPEFTTMFLDEARLMASFAHPNIAAVYSVGKDDESYFITMEHVRGPTLAALLTAAKRAGRRGLPRRSALGIILQIAEALGYVHELRDDIGRPQAIIHRDLNPANVMVSYTGAVKLIDFGIAKAATKVYETRTGVIKGTYGYMAPEQLSKRDDMDHRADIFALGVMMYEVCLGIHPFDASTEANIIDRLLKAAYRKPRELDPGFPKDLDRLIGRCMAVDPEARPENMHEVVEAIAAHLEHHQQVPTMRRVSDLAHSLIPDTESPAPLEPMTRSPQREREGDVAEQIYDREREQLDTLPGRDGGTQPTVRRERDENTREQTVPVRLRPIASNDETDTVIANRPPTGALDVPLVGAAGMGLSEQLTQAQPLPPERIAEARAETQVNRATAAPPSSGRLRQLALFIGSTTLVFGVGIGAFMAARAFSGAGAGPPPDVVTPPPDAAAATPDAEPDAEPEPEPEPRWLNVTSEPPGARIFVDGTQAPLETPATLELPMDTERVIVRAEMEGYVTQERPIHATAGEARFVLTALTVPDAGPDGSADAAPAGAPMKARPRMRRRRPRMRRR